MTRKKFNIGQKVSTVYSFNQEEVNLYNEIIKDNNPIHFDEKYSSKTIFGGNIVPGMLVISLFGGLLGSQLPGNGTILIGQSFSFKKPVYINEKVTSEIVISKIRNDKSIIRLEAICYKENSEIAVEGELVVLYKDIFKKLQNK